MATDYTIELSTGFLGAVVVERHGARDYRAKVFRGVKQTSGSLAFAMETSRADDWICLQPAGDETDALNRAVAYVNELAQGAAFVREVLGPHEAPRGALVEHNTRLAGEREGLARELYEAREALGAERARAHALETEVVALNERLKLAADVAAEAERERQDAREALALVTRGVA